MAKKKKGIKPLSFKKPIRLLWVIFLSGMVGIFLLFGGAALGWYGPMPDLQQLENPKHQFSLTNYFLRWGNAREILF